MSTMAGASSDGEESEISSLSSPSPQTKHKIYMSPKTYTSSQTKRLNDLLSNPPRNASMPTSRSNIGKEIKRESGEEMTDTESAKEEHKRHSASREPTKGKHRRHSDKRKRGRSHGSGNKGKEAAGVKRKRERSPEAAEAKRAQVFTESTPKLQSRRESSLAEQPVDALDDPERYGLTENGIQYLLARISSHLETRILHHVFPQMLDQMIPYIRETVQDENAVAGVFLERKIRRALAESDDERRVGKKWMKMFLELVLVNEMG